MCDQSTGVVSANRSSANRESVMLMASAHCQQCRRNLAVTLVQVHTPETGDYHMTLSIPRCCEVPGVVFQDINARDQQSDREKLLTVMNHLERARANARRVSDAEEEIEQLTPVSESVMRFRKGVSDERHPY